MENITSGWKLQITACLTCFHLVETNVQSTIQIESILLLLLFVAKHLYMVVAVLKICITSNVLHVGLLLDLKCFFLFYLFFMYCTFLCTFLYTFSNLYCLLPYQFLYVIQNQVYNSLCIVQQNSARIQDKRSQQKYSNCPVFSELKSYYDGLQQSIKAYWICIFLRKAFNWANSRSNNKQYQQD